MTVGKLSSRLSTVAALPSMTVGLFSRSPVAPAWMLVGPCSIIFLFVFISVKLIEDRQLANKGDAYKLYMRDVPSALLLVPPPLGKAIGSRIYGDGGEHVPEMQ